MYANIKIHFAKKLDNLLCLCDTPPMYPYRKIGQKIERGLPFWAKWWPLLQHRHASSYLSQAGWHASIKAGKAITPTGAPLPWYTYPTIDFLRPHLQQNGKNWTVFEYGSGQSTHYWAEHCKHVHALEHDANWRAHLTPTLPANVNLLSADARDKQAYAETISTPNQKFDIIIIDAKNRNTCAKIVPNHLTPDGIIIWDDSERVSNKQGLKFLLKNDFKALHFIGLGPLHAQPSRTTIFYRAKNIFNI